MPRVRGNSMTDAYIPDGSMALIQWFDVPKDSMSQAVRIDGRITLKWTREGKIASGRSDVKTEAGALSRRGKITGCRGTLRGAAVVVDEDAGAKHTCLKGRAFF